MKAAELSSPVSQTVLLTRPPDLGKLFQYTSSLKRSTGETWMAETTCHGIRTSTFLVIADHAGLREQPVLLLTDLTF